MESGFVVLRWDSVFFHPPDGPGLHVVIRAAGTTILDDYMREATILGFEIPDVAACRDGFDLTVEYPDAVHPQSAGHAEGRHLTAWYSAAWLVRGPARQRGAPDRGEDAAIRQTLAGFGAPTEAQRIDWSVAAAPGCVATAVGASKASVVFVGNCLAGLLASGLSSNRSATDRFSFDELPLNLRSIDGPDSLRLVSDADFIFVQGIVRGEFERVRDRVRPCCRVVLYPDVVLRNVWPFLEGEEHERIRKAREGSRFIHVDAALERLRSIETDPRRRVDAYAALAHGLEGTTQRSAEAQGRFLKDIDRAMGTGTGRFIADNFARRRLFHDSVHPTSALAAEMCRSVLRRLGVPSDGERFEVTDGAAAYVVPVHPIIAQRLGLAWAGKKTRFRYGSLGEVTWREWAEAYVEEYG